MRTTLGLAVAVTAVTAATSSAAAVPAADAGAAADDPRPALVELQLAADERSGGARIELLREVIARVEAALSADSGAADRWGLDYLHGDLLERLGRPQEAAQAFADVLAHSPALEPYGRYRLARGQEEKGHPEVAAGVIAKVVAAPPRRLAEDAVRLFHRTLAKGGDCRLLGPISRGSLADPERRRIDLAVADCAVRRGEVERGRDLYLRLLREALADDTARLAAERLDRMLSRRPAPAAETGRLVGLALHEHGDFERAIHYLEPIVAAYSGTLSDAEYDVAYAVARAYFRREQFPLAAGSFSRLAERTTSPRRRARALYQAGRSLELAGDWAPADAAFRLAYRADPTGRIASSALFAGLRLEWRRGNEAAARELYRVLAAQPRWTGTAARAGLFMAASDLVRGRADRAGQWLDRASRAGRDTALEVAYWRGRKAELEDAADAAVAAYLDVLRIDSHHPLGREARTRLDRPELAEPAHEEGVRLAASTRTDDLYAAALLLGDSEPWGSAALARLRQRAAGDRNGGELLDLDSVPIGAWPLWRQSLDEPEEMLLALGLWREGTPAVGRHFPSTSPDLAFTAAGYLERAGEIRPAIRIAEILARRLPDRLPVAAQPRELRRLLYPFAHSELLVEHSLEQGVDPYLLAAIIREESRFDPRALSSASARGLTQFVHLTAQRIGRDIGLASLTPEDLYRPEVSIALGAAYLGELARRFDSRPHVMAAAYNAGEPQALVWRSWCFSDEPAEYYTKTNFSQTRGYLEKVLRSWAHYREIYSGAGRPAAGDSSLR